MLELVFFLYRPIGYYTVSQSFCALTIDTCSHPDMLTFKETMKWYWLRKGRLIIVCATSHVGHNTKNEAAVTLSLRMWRFHPLLYRWTVILTHFQYVNIYNSLEYLVRYTVMTDDIRVAHDKEIICRCGAVF